jgi:hypothetical protein
MRTNSPHVNLQLGDAVQIHGDRWSQVHSAVGVPPPVKRTIDVRDPHVASEIYSTNSILFFLPDRLPRYHALICKICRHKVWFGNQPVITVRRHR